MLRAGRGQQCCGQATYGSRTRSRSPIRVSSLGVATCTVTSSNSSSIGGRARRLGTPRGSLSSRREPTLHAVAVPLQDQALSDINGLSLELVKVEISVAFATSFGQQLKVVGGAPELGEWDVSRAPTMTWTDGHRWSLSAYLAPGTYPFKLVVAPADGSPAATRWEQGPNRSLAIAANSPELGTAALVLAECVFDQTAHTTISTKRITGIGFRSSSIKGNPHVSSSSTGHRGSGDSTGAALPSASALAGSSARMAAAVGIPTSKVTANAYQPPPPAAAAAAAAPGAEHHGAAAAFVEPSAAPPAAQVAASGAAATPGSVEFATRMAAIDSQLAQLLGKPFPGSSSCSSSDHQVDHHGHHHQVDSSSSSNGGLAAAAAEPPGTAAPAAMHTTAQAGAGAAPAGTPPVHPGSLVSNFIKGHLSLVETQAAAMLKQNELLERRMAALEEHVQSYDDSVLGALTGSLKQQQEAEASYGYESSSSTPSAASGGSSYAAAAADASAQQHSGASDLVRQFMSVHSNGSSSDGSSSSNDSSPDHASVSNSASNASAAHVAARPAVAEHGIVTAEELAAEYDTASVATSPAVFFSPVTSYDAEVTAAEAEVGGHAGEQQAGHAAGLQPHVHAAAGPSGSSSNGATPPARVAEPNPDPRWQAAHARALHWANSQAAEEESSDSDVEEEDIPWWIRDSLPAVRTTPRTVGGGGGGSLSVPGSPPGSPYSSLKWTRSRVMSPAFAASAAALAERKQRRAATGWDDPAGDSSSSTLRRGPGQGFTASAVTLSIATPGNAAAAASAADASPLVHSLQQHAWKAAKATGQSDQAAAIAATAAAARVAHGYPDSPVADSPTGRRSSRRRQQGRGAAATIAAAVRTRQQVLAVTDVALRLSAAAENTGTSGVPLAAAAGPDGGRAAAAAEPEAAAAVALDARPESLAPGTLLDHVLMLPKAADIAAAAAVVGRSSGHSSTAAGSDGDGEADDLASDDELEQLAVLQLENQILSELAGIHNKMSAMQARAMLLEQEAREALQAGHEQQEQQHDPSASVSANIEDPAEAMKVGGVMGLALVNKARQTGGHRSQDVAAVRKLVEAMQLRMQAALLQTEAANKRQALIDESVLKKAAAAAAAKAAAGSGGCDRSIDGSADALQRQELQPTATATGASASSGSSSDSDEEGDGTGGRGGRGGRPARSRGTAVRPASAAVDASALAEAAVAVVAGDASAEWEREAMTTVTAVAGVMSDDETGGTSGGSSGPNRRSSRNGPGGGSRGGSGSSGRPGSAAHFAAASAASSQPTAAGSASAAAVASSAFALQQDLNVMRRKIAVLQSKVASRRAQVNLMKADSMGPASTAASGHAAHSVSVSNSSGRVSPLSPGLLASAAAAAAAATAVAAAGSVPAAASPTPSVLQPSMTARLNSSSSLGNRAVIRTQALAPKPEQSAGIVLASGAAGLAVASALSSKDQSGSDSSSDSSSSWAGRVYSSPALVAEAGPELLHQRPSLAALEARAAAAVAAREQLSQLAQEVQSSLAVLAPEPAAAGAPAAGSDRASRSALLSQKANRAAKAVEVMSDWEEKAASAKHQLLSLERQAAEALAELEQHQASTARAKQRQLLQRQLLAPAWKRQQELLAAIEAAGSSSARAYAWPVATAAVAVQVTQVNQMTCVLGSCVPDPAAAAIAGGVAIEHALQHAGHVLHNMHL